MTTRAFDGTRTLAGLGLLASVAISGANGQQAGTHVVVDPAAGAVTAVAGKPVAFNAAGSTPGVAGRALTYQWDFGDGTTGVGATKSAPATTSIRVVIPVKRP